MLHKFALAALTAVFALGTASAQAEEPPARNTLSVVGTGVGLGITAAYWSLNDWHWKWNSARHGFTAVSAWGLTTMGCAALSPIVATAVLNRPLTTARRTF